MFSLERPDAVLRNALLSYRFMLKKSLFGGPDLVERLGARLSRSLQFFYRFSNRRNQLSLVH